MADMKTTTDHQVIQDWIERFSGQPAAVVDPNVVGGQVGLRIDFPGHTDEVLLTRARNSRTISWEAFFKTFEDKQLAFEYDPDPDEIDLVDAYRFVNRNPQKEPAEKINPDEVEDAIRDGLPKYYQHGGRADNPHLGEVESVTPSNVLGEEELGGDTPDLESDDDTTQAARQAGLLDREEKKVQHD